MHLSQDLNSSQYIIQSFEPGKVKINGQWHTTSMALDANHLATVPASTLSELCVHHFEALLGWQPQLILLGTGPTMKIPDTHLTGPIIEQGVGIEFMDSAAACRTFHVLTSENRQVAAMLLVD